MQDDELIWQIDLSADFSGIRHARQSLDSVLRCQGWVERQIGCWCREISELIGRLVNHASPAAQHIWLRLYQQQHGWRLELEDDAGPFDPREPQPIELSGSDTQINASLWDLPDPNLLQVKYQRLVTHNLCTLSIEHSPLHGRILLIHREVVLRTLLADYLSDQYTVSAFSSANDALAIFARQGADLVLTDLGHEEFDGLALRHAMAHDPNQGLPPFLFLTGSHDPETRLLAAGLGAEDYLLMPICKAELLGTVNRVLMRQQNRKERCGEHIDPVVTAALRPSLPASISPFGLSMGVRGSTLGGSDFVLLQGRRLLLGDVMGRGEQARSFAHAYAGYLRGLLCALPKELGPAQILHKLAEIMLSDPLLSQTQVLVQVLNLDESGAIRIASAGFPMPWRIGRQGLSVLAGSAGMTGLGGDFHAQEITVMLEPGERLLIHSDGMRYDNPQWIDQFQHWLPATLEHSLESSQQKILQLFDVHHAGQVQDDLTLVLLERLC